MRIPTRLTRDEQKVVTRTRVLEAAVRVFAAEGYGGASVDLVAAHAGFTKGAVYAHFPTKDALFMAAIELVSAAGAATWANRDQALLVAEAVLIAARRPKLRREILGHLERLQARSYPRRALPAARKALIGAHATALWGLASGPPRRERIRQSA